MQHAGEFLQPTLTMNGPADNPLLQSSAGGGPRVSPATLASGRLPCFNADVSAVDYRAPAELYASASKTGKRPMRYTRFKNAAEAIKYAVEELPPELLIGSTLEVNEERFDGFGIRALYESVSYPLRRRKTG
jgi:hypothetical protein